MLRNYMNEERWHLKQMFMFAVVCNSIWERRTIDIPEEFPMNLYDRDNLLLPFFRLRKTVLRLWCRTLLKNFNKTSTRAADADCRLSLNLPIQHKLNLNFCMLRHQLMLMLNESKFDVDLSVIRKWIQRRNTIHFHTLN
jgi:hypothetical protein